MQQVFLILTLSFRLRKHTFSHQGHVGVADFVQTDVNSLLLVAKNEPKARSRSGQKDGRRTPRKEGGSRRKEGGARYTLEIRPESGRDHQHTKNTKLHTKISQQIHL